MVVQLDTAGILLTKDRTTISIFGNVSIMSYCQKYLESLVRVKFIYINNTLFFKYDGKCNRLDEK